MKKLQKNTSDSTTINDRRRTKQSYPMSVIVSGHLP